MNGMLIRVIRAACAVSITAVITNVPSRAPTTRPRTSTPVRRAGRVSASAGSTGHLDAVAVAAALAGLPDAASIRLGGLHLPCGPFESGPPTGRGLRSPPVH